MKNHILLIEDDSFITQMYATKIDELGFNVFTASNQPEVKDILAKNGKQISLILLDLILPDVSGFDILQWIKKQANLKDIPVVVLSNLSSQADINQAFELGAVDYIVKSNYTPTEVMRTVQKYLPTS
jgi:putative two-component system response regulator